MEKENMETQISYISMGIRRTRDERRLQMTSAKLVA